MTKRGRPEYAPTKAERDRVAIAAGGGMSHEEIATALGISRNTLEKHFDAELTVGSYAKRLEIINAMHKAGKKGNVAAQKAYLAMSPLLTLPPPPAQPPGDEKAVAAKKGKKEQAQQDAVGAQDGTGWSELLPGPQQIQ